MPAISAYPIELSGDPLARRAIPDRHGPIALSSATVDVLREYEAESAASLRGDTAAAPAVRMIKESGRWRAIVSGLAPGAYRITVEAVNVPIGGREIVGVIEPWRPGRGGTQH